MNRKMNKKMNKKMNLIHDKIYDVVLDSEIIREMESTKKIPGFNINWIYYHDHNRTLLMTAVFQNCIKLVKYILAAHPDININHQDNNGETVLYRTRSVYVLKLLLKHKDIDVNIQNNKLGCTILHILCYSNNIDLIRELLIDARADVMIRDNQGKTARDIAINYEYDEILYILKRIGCTTLLRIPNASLCKDIVRMIIEEYVSL